MDLIKEINKDPLNTLKKLSIKEIVNFLEECDIEFFNTGNTLISDDIYDIIKSYLTKLDKNNKYLKNIGTAEIKKVKLDFYMGSQTKIKDDEKAIIKWINKYNNPSSYIISQKLDGISAMIIYIDGIINNIYTRGDGYYGQDITHIKDFINIPKELIDKNIKKLVIRGELIIDRKNWKKIQLETDNLFSNARNCVAGAIHTIKSNINILKYVDFIAYDVLYPRDDLKESFNLLKLLKYPIVEYQEHSLLNLDILSNLLQNWRKNSNYDIDGIVIVHNKKYKILEGKNPSYSFAFKSILTHEQAEVVVSDVIWNISKDKFLKPTIIFNEILLNNVKINKTTGFNAKFINDNNIGPGSHLIIIRSGDVIPHIQSVLSPSSNGIAKMPLNYDFIWNNTMVDILLKDDLKNKEQDIKTFVYFMKILDIPFIKEGVLTKLYDNGFDTLKKIINIKLDDLLKIEGFKETISLKILESLKNIKNVDAIKILDATNILGRGFSEKKIKLIIDEFPFILYDKDKTLKLTINDLIKINGISVITAKQFLDNISKYYDFCDEIDFDYKKIKKHVSIDNDNDNIIINDKIINKNFVFSGIRNKNYEKIINDNKGNILNTITKNVNYLIIKDINDTSTKITKARDLGITILPIDSFENYFI